MAVVPLAEHVQNVVEEERVVVATRLGTLQEQQARLRVLLEKVDEEVEGTARLLRGMDEMLGLAPQLSLEALHGELRGRKLQEIAIELLRQERGVGSVVHYKEWYELLVAAGLRVGGKDPLGSFLTQIARASSVESVRPRSGLFRLKSA